MTGILRRYRYTGYQTFRMTKTVWVDGSRRNVLRPSSEWIISDFRPDLQIITVEEFNAVQARLAATSRAHGEAGAAPAPRSESRPELPLKGLVRCARCGGAMSAKTDKGVRWERYVCNNARNRTNPGMKYCGMGSGVVRYRLEDAFAELMGDELKSLEKTARFVESYNARLASVAGDRGSQRMKFERRLAEIKKQVEQTWNDSLTAGMTPAWIAELRQKLDAEEQGLRERLALLAAPAEDPVQISAEKGGSVRAAIQALAEGGAIDSSKEEGIELLAALRELVEMVVLDVHRGGAFTMRVVIRPGALAHPGGGQAAGGRVELERSFAKAVRGYYGSPRFARQMAVRAAEGAHRLLDEEWEAIRRLVPARVACSSRKTFGRAVGDPRSVVEAAIFHLQTGAPLRELPTCFGLPAEVFKALRRLEQSDAWRSVEPKLRMLAPRLFEGVRRSKTFPIGNPETPLGEVLPASVEGKAEAGLHRLSDREWALVRPLVHPKVTEFGDPAFALDARRLLDGIMFMLKEGIPYARIPFCFGPRDRFQTAVRRLVRHHCWDRMVVALRASSPGTLVGADLSRLDGHVRLASPDLAFFIQHGPDEIRKKLLRAEELHTGGATYKEAAKQLGITENTLHRWRFDPRYRID